MIPFFNVPLLPVIVATVAAMIIGAIWYAPPVFGNTWMRLIGLTEDKAKKSAMKAIIMATLMSLIMATVLSSLIHARLTADVSPAMGALYGLWVALWIWIGFVVTNRILHAMFEQQPWKLIILNATHDLLVLLSMGAILGAWH